MKRDIEGRADIDLLMKNFYGRAISDELIGYIFTDVAKLDLEHHLPVIGDFWESFLFGTAAYKKHGRNPLQVHQALDLKERLLPEHFERWLEIFDAVVDNEFAGEIADYLKMRAHAIADRFQHVLGTMPAAPLTPRRAFA